MKFSDIIEKCDVFYNENCGIKYIYLKIETLKAAEIIFLNPNALIKTEITINIQQAKDLEDLLDLEVIGLAKNEETLMVVV